jgi:hypothetical protein
MRKIVLLVVSMATAVLLACGALAPVLAPPAAASSCGSSWSIVPSPTLFDAPRAIAPVGSDDIWIVGSRRDNAILSTGAAHWDGNGWTMISTPNRTTGGYSENVLNGADALGSNNVWSVGYSGVGGTYKTLIERWDGSRWRIVQSPNVGASSNTLTGVDAIARNQVWAVGYRRHGAHRETLVLRWNGTSWLAVTSPNPGMASNALLAVAAVSGNNVWAVGYKRGSAGHRSLLLRYDGTSWKQVAVPALGDGDNVLTGVSATSGNNVWVAGYYVNGTQYRPLTLHYDGSAWETLLRDAQGGPVSATLDVYASSASDVWTVGFQYRLAQNDLVASSWHWDGSTSTAFSNAVAKSATKSEMLAVTEAPGLPQQVWAAGQPANVETICPAGNSPALSSTQEKVGAPSDEPVRASRATSSASAEASTSAAATVPAESTAPAGSTRPLATGLGVEAVNKAEEAGLSEFTRTYGAIVTDFDNDGLKDIFLGRHGSAPRLYLDDGNGHFSESNEGAWNQRDRHGCDAADVNGDGLKDIYCAVGALHGSGTKLNELYIQQPNNTFVDRGAQYGGSEPFGRGRSATFVNADNNAFPDLFVVNETDRGDGLPSPNRLFTNQGGSAFKYNSERGLEFEGDGGAAYEVDFNKDGWQDLFVDTLSSSRVAAPLRVYRNDRGERFINVAGQVGLGHSVSDVTVANLNGDQWPDVIEVLPEELRVLLNEQGKFSLAFSTPLQYGVSVAAGDINGDGRQDLYVLRGEDSTGENAPDQVYVNAGNGENFSPMSSIPYTKEGEAESVWPIDYDRNGLTDFLVLNGAGARSNLGPVQLIAFFRTS